MTPIRPESARRLLVFYGRLLKWPEDAIPSYWAQVYPSLVVGGPFTKDGQPLIPVEICYRLYRLVQAAFHRP